jgi:hypothetical protein
MRDLPDERQQEVLDYIKILKHDHDSKTSAETNGLEEFFGILSPAEGAQMERAIEEAFEQIDWDEWPNMSRH